MTFELRSGDPVRLPVALWRHPAWAAGGPAILFLHGSGERGTDPGLVAEVGLGPALTDHPERWPVLAVMPQCPDGVFWTDGDLLERALQRFDEITAEVDADPHRCYLVGVSRGGMGAWALARLRPERFAAIVTVCGPGDAGPGPPDVPAWLFHGADDPVVDVAGSRRLAAALKEAGADVRYTEYEDTGHASWDRALGEDGLARWLLSHRRG